VDLSLDNALLALLVGTGVDSILVAIITMCVRVQMDNTRKKNTGFQPDLTRQFEKTLLSAVSSTLPDWNVRVRSKQVCVDIVGWVDAVGGIDTW
jgi:hypothetical protein